MYCHIQTFIVSFHSIHSFVWEVRLSLPYSSSFMSIAIIRPDFSSQLHLSENVVWVHSHGLWALLLSALNSNKSNFKYQARPDSLSGNVSINSHILLETQRNCTLNADGSIKYLKWEGSRLKFLNFC